MWSFEILVDEDSKTWVDSVSVANLLTLKGEKKVNVEIFTLKCDAAEKEGGRNEDN